MKVASQDRGLVDNQKCRETEQPKLAGQNMFHVKWKGLNGSKLAKHDLELTIVAWD